MEFNDFINEKGLVDLPLARGVLRDLETVISTNVPGSIGFWCLQIGKNALVGLLSLAYRG